jgi:enoyl-CoA hydratase/carnithine racemase
MPETGLLIEDEQSWRVLTLNRPERRNALSMDLLRCLIDSLRSAGANPDVRCIILASTGTTFCSGHDLTEMVGSDPSRYRQIFGGCSELMTTIRAIPQPVIAEVQGVATATGCQLVAACDLVVAAQNATFATPGTQIGMTGTNVMVELSRVIGRKRAMQMLLMCETVNAETAAAWGLVNLIVPASELKRTSRQWAARIAEASASTIGQSKTAYYAQIDMDLNKAYDYAKEIMSTSAMAPDAQERIAAFLGKRRSQPEP